MHNEAEQFVLLWIFGAKLSKFVTGLAVWGSNPGRDKIFCAVQMAPNRTHPYLQWTLGLSCG